MCASVRNVAGGHEAEICDGAARDIAAGRASSAVQRYARRAGTGNSSKQVGVVPRDATAVQLQRAAALA